MENVIYDKSWFDHEPVMAVLLNNQPSEKNNLDRTSDSSTYQDFVSLPYKEDNFSNCNYIIYIDETSLQGTGLFESTYFNVVDKLQIECMFLLGTGLPESSEIIPDEVIIPDDPELKYISNLNYVTDAHAVQLYGEPIEIVRQSYPPVIINSENKGNIIINAIDTPTQYITSYGSINTTNIEEDIVSTERYSISMSNDDTGVSYYCQDAFYNIITYMPNPIEDEIPHRLNSNYKIKEIIIDNDLYEDLQNDKLIISYVIKLTDALGAETLHTTTVRVFDLLYIQVNTTTALSKSGSIIFNDADHMPSLNGETAFFSPIITKSVGNVSFLNRETNEMLIVTEEQRIALADLLLISYDPMLDAIDGEHIMVWTFSANAAQIDTLGITMMDRMTVQYDIKIEDEYGSYTYEIVTIKIIPNTFAGTFTTNISVVIDGAGSMSQTDLNLIYELIGDIQDKYMLIGDVNLNVILFHDDTIGSYNSGWDTDYIDITLTASSSERNIQGGLEEIVEVSFNGSEPEANQNIVYYFGDGSTDGEYSYDLTTYMSDWFDFINSGKLDKFYTYAINSPEIMDDLQLISDNNENIISENIRYISDLTVDNINLAYNTLWIADSISNITDKYKIDKFPKPNPLFNLPSAGIKVSVYYSTKWYLETVRSRSRNLENLYASSPGMELDVMNISGPITEDILYSDLNIICLPDDPFTDDEIEFMRRALVKGNRLFFVGEGGSDEMVVNNILNDTIAALGGTIEISNEGLFDTLSKATRTASDPVGFGNNLNRSDLLAGVKFLDIGPFNKLTIDPTTTVALVVDDSDRIAIADEAVLNGRITVMAGSHLDLHYGGEPYDNTTFMRNMAIDSWTMNKYSREFIYMNDFILNPFDDIFYGQFVQVEKIGKSNSVNINMNHYFSKKSPFHMRYTNVYETFINTTIYPFLSEIYFDREDPIGDYNLFKYIKDNSNSPNAFETWLYAHSPWKGINRDCSIRDQRLKVHTYINIIETLLIH